jgi:hypothetical protein
MVDWFRSIPEGPPPTRVGRDRGRQPEPRGPASAVDRVSEAGGSMAERPLVPHRGRRAACGRVRHKPLGPSHYGKGVRVGE